MNRAIKYYKKENGKCPVKEYIDSLDLKSQEKILWTLKLLKEVDILKEPYFKKMQNSNDIWECRIKQGSNAYRLFFFFDEGTIIILTNGFSKKTQKTPSSEIEIAEKYKIDYYKRKKEGGN